jgi:hypothetical protein
MPRALACKFNMRARPKDGAAACFETHTLALRATACSSA